MHRHKFNQSIRQACKTIDSFNLPMQQVTLNKLKLKTSNPEYEHELAGTKNWLTLNPPSAAKGSPGHTPENQPMTQRIQLCKCSG